MQRPKWKHKYRDENTVKIGGHDRRKEALIGKVIVEPFSWEGGDGTRCVMKRDQVCSHEWLSVGSASLSLMIVVFHRGILSSGANFGRM